MIFKDHRTSYTSSGKPVDIITRINYTYLSTHQDEVLKSHEVASKTWRGKGFLGV